MPRPHASARARREREHKVHDPGRAPFAVICGYRDVGDYLRRVLHIAVRHQHDFVGQVCKTPSQVPLVSVGPHMVLTQRHEQYVIDSLPGAIASGTPAGFAFDCTSLDAVVRATVGAKPMLERIPRTEFAFRGGLRALRAPDAADEGEAEQKGDTPVRDGAAAAAGGAPGGVSEADASPTGAGAGDASVQDALQLLARLPTAFTDNLAPDVFEALVARCGGMDRDATVCELQYLVTLARFAAGAVAEAEAREDAEFEAEAHRNGGDEAVNDDGTLVAVTRAASVELAAGLAPKTLQQYEQELGVGARESEEGGAGAGAHAGGVPESPMGAGGTVTRQYRVQHLAHLIKLMVGKLRSEDHLYCRLPASMKVSWLARLLCGELLSCTSSKH